MLKVHPFPVSKVPKVLAVTGGKGGIGKSCISLNLSIALSRLGSKVCLFDADTGLANINIMLGLHPPYTLEHLFSGEKSIQDIVIEGPERLQVVPGASGAAECAELDVGQQQRLVTSIKSIESHCDYLVIDTAAGISPTVLHFVAAAQVAVVVITPEPTSLTDAFSLLKVLKRRGYKRQVQVVVNMVPSASLASKVYGRFSTAVAKYLKMRTEYLGSIWMDESIRNAVSLQRPVALFPRNDPSAKGFYRLAERVEDVFSRPSVPRLAFSAYWQKVAERHAPRIEPLEKGEIKEQRKPSNDTQHDDHQIVSKPSLVKELHTATTESMSQYAQSIVDSEKPPALDDEIYVVNQDGSSASKLSGNSNLSKDSDLSRDSDLSKHSEQPQNSNVAQDSNVSQIEPSDEALKEQALNPNLSEVGRSLQVKDLHVVESSSLATREAQALAEKMAALGELSELGEVGEVESNQAKPTQSNQSPSNESLQANNGSAANNKNRAGDSSEQWQSLRKDLNEFVCHPDVSPEQVGTLMSTCLLGMGEKLGEAVFDVVSGLLSGLDAASLTASQKETLKFDFERLLLSDASEKKLVESERSTQPKTQPSEECEADETKVDEDDRERYDQEGFGCQQELASQIRASEDQPLDDLLESIKYASMSDEA